MAACLPSRYVVTFLISVGLAIIYGLKVNLSVAIVVMVNNTGLSELAVSEHQHHDNEHQMISDWDTANDTSLSPEYACPAPDTGNQTVPNQDGPFLWSEPTQGLVLGSYFWGYIVGQIPGGRMAERFSAKWVLWASVLLNVVFTMLTPVAANLSYIAVLVVRIIEGFGAGASLPATQVLLSKWAPPKERNKLSSFAYAGMSLGTLIALPFSGFLAESLGWESVFYVQGGLSVLWLVMWVFLVYDSPQQHPRIDTDELELFANSMADGGKRKTNLRVPWKSIASSIPFWAIVVAHTCSNFGWYMLLVELPTWPWSSSTPSGVT